MRKLLFDKLINKNLWKIIAPQWMKAPPRTATKISQFRLVYGIMDKMDVTAQPKNPVSHTNTTIQIHTYKRLASSIAKSFALSVDEFALFQFNSIQFAALLFLSICVYFTFDKWWMPKRPSNRRPPLPQAQAHSLAQNARTCIFQPIQNWFYWVTQFVLTIFIEIRKLCEICHPKFVPWQTFLVWHTAHDTQHTVSGPFPIDARIQYHNFICKQKQNGKQKQISATLFDGLVNTLLASASTANRMEILSRTHTPTIS